MSIFIVLFIALSIAIVFALAKRVNRNEPPPPPPKYSTQDWLKAGGVLGFLVLVSRATRMPLITLISALPFILPEMRAGQAQQQTPKPSAMSREEAALILGVELSANEQQIREAHRRLITKNHPDMGGNAYLAAKINQARDVLLK